MVHPMFKQIDWNTIAESWWAIAITGATSAFCMLQAPRIGFSAYIVGGFILLTFAVQCITTKKTQQERDMIIDVVREK